MIRHGGIQSNSFGKCEMEIFKILEEIDSVSFYIKRVFIIVSFPLNRFSPKFRSISYLPNLEANGIFFEN